MRPPHWAAARGGRALREEDNLLRLDVQVARVPRDEEPVVAQLLVRSQTALLDEVSAADKGRWELEGFWAERVDRLAHAPLASTARAAAALLAPKPAALSFEQASTLPVTWSTTHVCLSRARVRDGHGIVVHAAAGGVGLTAVEYAHLLCVRALGTAGRPHKHSLVRAVDVGGSCSSRDAAAFAVGCARLLRTARTHAVLSSLSLDFISVSFACVGEGGAFEEIGKLGVWAAARHAAAAPHSAYCAVALDADMAHDPAWMQGVLCLLATRGRAGDITSLPLRSFDMEMQYELAFRTLQGGLNIGKVVLRLAARASAESGGAHIVTGGTGGLGLLTGRWLAQRGARRLALASRGGTIAHDANPEWQALSASGAAVRLERCDAAGRHPMSLTIADDVPLPDRLEALGQWCASFLAGFAAGLARRGAEERVAQPAEALDDVDDLARLATDHVSCHGLPHVERAVQVGAHQLLPGVDRKVL